MSERRVSPDVPEIPARNPPWPTVSRALAVRVRAGVQVSEAGLDLSLFRFLNRVPLDRLDAHLGERRSVPRTLQATQLPYDMDNGEVTTRAQVYLVGPSTFEQVMKLAEQVAPGEATTISSQLRNDAMSAFTEARSGLRVDLTAGRQPLDCIGRSIAAVFKLNTKTYREAGPQDVYVAVRRLWPKHTNHVLALVTADRVDESNGRVTKLLDRTILTRAKVKPELAEMALTVHQAALAPLSGMAPGADPPVWRVGGEITGAFR